jgi:hypothetical protein
MHVKYAIYFEKENFDLMLFKFLIFVTRVLQLLEFYVM